MNDDPTGLQVVFLWSLIGLANVFVWAPLGGALGHYFKSRMYGGALLGFLLGPFGLPFIAVFKPRRTRCPSCGKWSPARLSVCSHCETDFADAAYPPARHSMTASVSAPIRYCPQCQRPVGSVLEHGRIVARCEACDLTV